MANTTYSNVKAISLTDYMPAFKTSSDIQGWDWKKLYTMKKTSRATEQVFSYAGLPVAQQTKELQTLNYADMAELAATTFTVSKYTLATLFSHELLKDNQHLPEFLKEAGKCAGDSHSFAKDIAAASFLNNAFTAGTSAMYDGVALCGSHTMNDGTAFTNKLTTSSLTWDNLWEAVNKFETSLVAHSGIYLRDTPKFLAYHPSKEKEVRAILRTTEGQPGTADNDKNTIRDYNLVPVPCRHLSTSANWFLMGSRFPASNCWFTREGLSNKTEDDFDRMAVKFRSYQRWARGVKEFTYIFGNEGA